MGAVDATTRADVKISLDADAVTGSTNGNAVDCTNSRGEAPTFEITNVNANGDITLEVKEKDPGGSFSAVDDADLDFSASQLTTNGDTLTGVSGAIKEVLGSKGDAAERRH